MKGSWALWIAAFAMLAAGYVRLLGGRSPGTLVVVLSGVAASSVLIVAAEALAVFTRRTDAGAFRRARAGDPWRDGRLEVATGSVVPVGDALSSPFLDAPCVAYEYDVRSRAEGPHAPEGVVAAGLGVAPAVVRTGRGDVRLLGVSRLDSFDDAEAEDAPARSRAARFLAAARFEEHTASRHLSPIRVAREAAVAADGSARRDVRLAGAEIAPEECRLAERVIAVGAQVTVAGVWSAARGALVAGRGPRRALRILPGGGEVLARNLKKQARGAFAFAVVFFVLVQGVVAAVTLLGNR